MGANKRWSVSPGQQSQHRRSPRKWLLLLVLNMSLGIGIISLAPASYGDHPVSQATNPEKGPSLRVGLYENPPKLFTDPTHGPHGILIELLQEIAIRENWHLVFVACEWQDCLNQLEAGTLDIMPDVAYTEERGQRFDFHQIPALTSWSQIYRRPNEPIRTILDLDQKKIAMLKGSVQEEALRSMLQGFDIQFEIIPTDTVDDAFRLVQSGDVDAAAANHLFGDYNAARYGLVETPIVFLPSRLFYATPKNTPDHIHDRIDAYLSQWQANPGSPYYAIIRDWGQETPRSLIPPLLRQALIGLGGVGLMLAIGVLILRYQVKRKTHELVQVNQQLATTLDTIPDLLFEVTLAGKILDIHTARSPALEEIPALTPGQTLEQVLPLEIVTRCQEILQIADQEGYSQGHVIQVPLNEKLIWLELSIAKKVISSFPQSKMPHFIVLARDISDRKQAEAGIQRVNKLYAALSECNQAIVRCSTQTEFLREICYYAVTLGEMRLAWIGLLEPGEQSLNPVALYGEGGHYLDDLQISIDPEHPFSHVPTGIAIREDRPYWCQDYAQDPATAPWQERAKQFGWAASAALPLHCNGQVIGVLSLYAGVVNAFDIECQNLLIDMAQDIDFALERFSQRQEQARLADEIQRLAYFDQLTGLANRILFRDRFDYILSHAQRSGVPFTVMFMDLDHFKTINDSLGHAVGDALLMSVAHRLKSTLRSEDTIARQGGDEFIFILPGADASGATQVARKLLRVITEPFLISGYELFVTPSIGIALYPTDGTTIEDLTRNADAAMYQVKRESRNNFRFFTQELQIRSSRILSLGHALYYALERQELHLHYQPQICLTTGRVTGVEALLRWQHPEFGAVAPGEFIPIAENNGLIVAIGEWVLRSAAQQLRVWLDQGLPPLVMAVNLSVVQFRHPNLPHVIFEILQQSNLPPSLLELELTESVTMDDPQMALATIDQFSEQGIKMAIDDFGTGYSSLNYLKRLRAHKLKIDQSFIRDLHQSADANALVAGIIHLAHSLGMWAIAEGVETAAQIDFLRQQACDQVQGYYYSHPLSAEEFQRFLKNSLVNHVQG